ncbi:hypothetical protein FE257_008314 [Aspergillus nanangensis]|uniref:Uncharacterized protein n=1 Tax=Aspergillus nanangensis TaxID=2582783 RepID=A0AAD4CLI8_ASPNN|nr:hypothetical protein FE257_008314 [Aspergillus nanangensis]
MNPLRYLGAPTPFKAISQSTKKEIKERINFVTAITIHPHLDMSEPDRDALFAYRDDCQTVIDLGEDPDHKETRASATARIQQYEQTTLGNGGGPINLSYDLTTKTKLGEELDNLNNVWVFTRYEKYLPEEVKPEPSTSSSSSDPWHKDFWAPFHGRLEAETDAFAKVLSGQSHHNECPTSILLALLVERHTLDWDETVALIRACARDDVDLPAADFERFLTTRDAAGLATRLDRDEASISLSTEYVMGVGTMLLAFYSTTLPETLFDTDEFPAAKWTPKKPLEELFGLEEGQHEEAIRGLFSRLFAEMADGGSEDEIDDAEFEDYDDDDDDLEEGLLSDDSDDY